MKNRKSGKVFKKTFLQLLQNLSSESFSDDWWPTVPWFMEKVPQISTKNNAREFFELPDATF